MGAPIEICFRGFKPESGVERQIRLRLAKLESSVDDIVRSQVFVEKIKKHKCESSAFCVGVFITLADNSVVTSLPYFPFEYKNIYMAIRQAFSTVYRQLKESHLMFSQDAFSAAALNRERMNEKCLRLNFLASTYYHSLVRSS